MAIPLIVPYGIETLINASVSTSMLKPLIVPYGIETGFSSETEEDRQPLIVPYGIETIASVSETMIMDAFNCTLWN